IHDLTQRAAIEVTPERIFIAFNPSWQPKSGRDSSGFITSCREFEDSSILVLERTNGTTLGQGHLSGIRVSDMALRGTNLLIAGASLEGCEGTPRALVAELDPGFRRTDLWRLSEPYESNATTIALMDGKLLIGGSVRRALSLDPDDVKPLDLSSDS